MTQKKFGSESSTGRKLEVVERYLKMYQIALKNTPLKTNYIDAFAGTGVVPLEDSEPSLFDDDEVKAVINGSVERAISVQPPFDRYVFIEQSRQKILQLEARQSNSALRGRMTFLHGDANRKVAEICAPESWRGQRGVIFLDPFGNQVWWETVEAIARTKALDLWYLFPAGLGVFRQISNQGYIQHRAEESINRMFGTKDWKSAFLKPIPQNDLFDDQEITEKSVTPESAAQFMIERMKTIFAGGVLDELIPLGKHAYPSFYLIFAWSNPSPKASKLAKKLSRAAIKATDRNRHGKLI